jgi:hypothetical protein
MPTSKTTVILLIFCFSISFIIPSFAFDNNKLLEIKPLASERLDQLAKSGEQQRKWWGAGLGLLGLGLISQNTAAPIDDNKLYALGMGSLALILGGTLYSMPSDYEIEQQTWNNLKTSGVDTELNAYYRLKAYAKNEENLRHKISAFTFLYGVAGILLANNASGATQSYKALFITSGTVFMGLGLVLYLWPGEAEKQFSDLNKSLN